MRVGYMGDMESQNTRVWIEEMAQRGVTPVAICEKQPSWDVEWAPLTVEPPKIRGIGLGRRAIARKLAHICSQRDVMLLQNHFVNRYAFWARSSGFRPRVLTCWGSDVLRLKGKPLGHRLGVRMALRTADAITVGSEHLLAAAVRAGAQREKCVRVGWGVDVNRFRPDLGLRQRIRAEWGLEDRVVVLSTRQLTPLYRVDAIIEAFSYARAREPRLALVVAADGPERASLQQQAHSLGLEDDALFLGAIFGEAWPQMPAVYAGADVYCSVPESDGGPLSVLEAMASGLPIVGADLPVMREWIEGAHVGVLWDGSDPKELGNLILDVLPERGRMGESAREYVMRDHERGNEMDKVYDLYERLVKGSLS